MNTIYNVTQLNNHTKSILESNLNNIWVKGEVSSLKLYNSGHLYFTLKDCFSEIQCVAFNFDKRNSFDDGSLITIYGNTSRGEE